MKRIISISILILILSLCLLLSGCAIASASEEEQVTELLQTTVKEGYYLSDRDNSYIYISDGKIQVINFDTEKYLEDQYKNAIKTDEIDSKSISMADFIRESENNVEIDDEPIEFSVMSFPGGEVMLVTRKEETGNGGGAYFGYMLEDENTISSLYNYSYVGEKVNDSDLTTVND